MVLARRLVQDQGEVIEAHHLMEPAGQLVEQRGQIAVRDDRLRNGQQGPVLVAGGSRLSVEVSGCHGEDPGRSPIRNRRVVRRIPAAAEGQLVKTISPFVGSARACKSTDQGLGQVSHIDRRNGKPEAPRNGARP